MDGETADTDIIDAVCQTLNELICDKTIIQVKDRFRMKYDETMTKQ